jgi:hypothetical protein
MVSKISPNLSGPHVKQILRHLWPPRELDEFTSWQRQTTEAQITKLIFDAVFKVIRCCQEVSRIPGKSKTTPVSHWPDCLVSGSEEPEKLPHFNSKSWVTRPLRGGLRTQSMTVNPRYVWL